MATSDVFRINTNNSIPYSVATIANCPPGTGYPAIGNTVATRTINISSISGKYQNRYLHHPPASGA